jgi:hypothetical protein
MYTKSVAGVILAALLLPAQIDPTIPMRSRPSSGPSLLDTEEQVARLKAIEADAALKQQQIRLNEQRIRAGQLELEKTRRTEPETKPLSVLVGRPFREATEGPGSSSSRVLLDEDGKNNEMGILFSEGTYFWMRNKQRMRRVDAARYVVLIAEDGSGYVRLGINEDGKSFTYMEHVSGALTTITYWGQGEIRGAPIAPGQP